MKLSIVIPTMRHLGDCLVPCIRSIDHIVQHFNIEVIIVANGSKDTTFDYVSTLGENYTCLFFGDQQLGAPRAYNTGIKASSGDYVLLINDDIVMLDQNWLAMLMFPFDQDPKVGLTGPLKFRVQTGSIEREAFAFWCTMVKREVFDKIGYLDEIFSPFGCEDIDFCIRAAEAGYKLVQVPEDTSNKFLVEKPQGARFPIFHKGSVSVDDVIDYNFEAKKALEHRNMSIILERYSR